MNKGVMSQSSENSTPTDLDTLKFLMNNLKNAYQFRIEQMIKYLCDKQSSFPEYTQGTNISDLQPSNSNYFSGLWLGDENGFDDRFLGLNSHTRDIL